MKTNVSCVPLDPNVHKQEKVKIDNYTLLTISLYRLYPNDSYEVVPIVLGATGLVTNSLVTYMSKLFDKNVSLEIIPKLQLGLDWLCVLLNQPYQ